MAIRLEHFLHLALKSSFFFMFYLFIPRYRWRLFKLIIVLIDCLFIVCIYREGFIVDLAFDTGCQFDDAQYLVELSVAREDSRER